jgi:hypothetical protein
MRGWDHRVSGADRMDTYDINEIMVRMQIEWVEMPQLRLTRRQAERLWTLPGDVCEAAFGTLVRSGFLVQGPDGAYVRRPFAHRWAQTAEPLVRAS